MVLTGKVNVSRVATALIAVALTLLLSFGASFASPLACMADEGGQSVAAQQDKASDEAGSTQGAAQPSEGDSTEEQATETIEDEETPLVASIAGSEPIPLKVINDDLHWILLGVAVIVGVVFLMRTGRLNRNIDKMQRFIK